LPKSIDATGRFALENQKPMRSIDDFFSERYGPSSPSVAFTSRQYNRYSALSDEVREAANRGWRVFPVTQLAKLTGNHDLLIGEATSDISRLEELAAEPKPYGWRFALLPSSLCVLQLVGQEGRDAFAALI
jgi:hypothetical protein